MKTHILTTADTLSDQDLLTRLGVLAGNERDATVELVAHLAALVARPNAYAAEGYGSLFLYCTRALGFSEDAACNRIEAARACRRFPVILDLLATGALTLTSVRRLARHLTAENHEAVLEKAKRRSLREIDVLVAGIAPQPDVPTSVRKLPTPILAPTPIPAAVPAPAPATVLTGAPVAMPRPVLRASAPERYRVQFTIGRETHDKIRRLQALLRREIPDGDAGAIFDRAVTLLLAKVEATKLGVTARPRRRPPIRSATDETARTSPPSRDVPRAVQRAVSERDGRQCACVSRTGTRCAERSFLEFHHVQPYAKGGPATVDNIALRCRRHNQYEAELASGRWEALSDRVGAPPNAP
jgi:5-methylcytosine-specific restriction endonuclease McrA